MRPVACAGTARTPSRPAPGRPRHQRAGVPQALAHLRHCRACQAQHGTSAEGLQARFDQRLVMFLPTPFLLSGHSAVLERAWATLERAWRGAQRWTAPQAGARERVAEIAAGDVGAGAKLAA